MMMLLHNPLTAEVKITSPERPLQQVDQIIFKSFYHLNVI